jgi:L-ascorbate metabolism protein UlaG (beta-lactamase superfamily)
MATRLTWLGASAFRLTTAAGAQIYFDPWLENSDCPADERSPIRVDMIILSHGHFDHVGQTLALWKTFRPKVVAPQDVRRWLEKRGVERDDRLGPDMGGTILVGDATISLTDARHSGGSPEGDYGGAPCGFVLRLPDTPSLYFAGDTCTFGDMQLIGRMHRPDIAILPIGGHYTMDPAGAALALELLGVKRCIPCHYRYFADPPPPRAVLPGKPHHLRALVPDDVEIIAPAPGETIVLEAAA